MMIKEIELGNYLFNTDPYELTPSKRMEIRDRLSKEMIEIHAGKNLY